MFELLNKNQLKNNEYTPYLADSIKEEVIVKFYVKVMNLKVHTMFIFRSLCRDFTN